MPRLARGHSTHPHLIVARSFFKKRRRTFTIALLLVVLAVVNFLLTDLITPDAPAGPQVFRLVLMLLLALFLALGKNWARWVAVVLTGLGAVVCLIAAGLMSMTELSAGNLLIAAGMLVAMLIYGGISVFLATSQGVTREIRRANRRFD